MFVYFEGLSLDRKWAKARISLPCIFMKIKRFRGWGR
jgi:hypothetical protein